MSEPLRLGTWDGERILDLDAPRAMEYGPQGGQHFFVDVELLVPIEDRLRLELDFIDSQSEERTGAARWQENVGGCGHVITDVPVVMLEPVAQRGHLDVEVTLGDCSWRVELENVEVVGPPSEHATSADAGAAGGELGDAGAADPSRNGGS